MRFSIEGKFFRNSKFTAEERARIIKAVHVEGFDVDLCKYRGKTIIYYSWGNQKGAELLAEAVYDGPLPSS